MATLVQTMQHVLETKDPLLANETKRIVLKEVLQAYILDYLYSHPTYRHLNFYGGTCLHVVYDLNRLSEDLDLDNGNQVNLSGLADDLLEFFSRTWGYGDTIAKPQQSEQGILRVTLKFPILNALRLSDHPNETLHLKVEISHHQQIAVVQHTPVLYHGRSFVPGHFSLETMMAGKMIACLERNFQKGTEGTFIKGRDFYDLLWFMQKGVQPLEEKLVREGARPYTVQSAMLALDEKVKGIRRSDLAIDLLPMFESRSFIEAWIDAFHNNFNRFIRYYVEGELH